MFNMVNPRKRFRLEAFKFSVYLFIPIAVTVAYSSPETMNRLLNSFKYVEYPPEGEKPPVGDELLRHLEARAKKRGSSGQPPAATQAGVQGGLVSASSVAPKQGQDGPGAPSQGDGQGLQKEPGATETGSSRRGRGWFGWLRRGA